MAKSHALIAVVTSVALLVASAASYADPGNGNGNSKGHGQGKGQAQHSQGQGNAGGKKNGSQAGEWPGGPSIDRGDVLGILSGHRSYWNPGAALPPGIQKNLARGKPLPPGIAKKLDGRLLGQLPHYEGYEWLQAGVDLILVAVSTGIIYEVVNGAFD
ncbi:anti-virulence regulator CigR family protein [Pseudomonas kermanshahensis]|uniref:anti-virulence regulator CigR family protein n=1 Tax=Pseudomonas kermanshahensis TaxID=2745482 RepID=UPI0023DB3EE9|nr:anti-virulence regulator CigR family protein [Pseudomonas kermanshahensis]WEL53637.1 anti-virulence regulator CigR family protein [Pseudomonas kermanshahensis]